MNSSLSSSHSLDDSPMYFKPELKAKNRKSFKSHKKVHTPIQNKPREHNKESIEFND